MLSFFKRDNRQVEVQRAMGRLINSTFEVEAYAFRQAGEVRAETRAARSIQCLVVQLNEMQDVIRFWSSMSVDLSMQGALVFSSLPLPNDEKTLVLLFAQENDFQLFTAKCAHCKPQPLGGFLSGLRLESVVPLKNYSAIGELLEVLQNRTEDDDLSIKK